MRAAVHAARRGRSALLVAHGVASALWDPSGTARHAPGPPAVAEDGGAMRSAAILLRAPNPRCSGCVKQRRRLVEFMAMTSEQALLGHRGASRRVRLCERCLLALIEVVVEPPARAQAQRKARRSR